MQQQRTLGINHWGEWEWTHCWGRCEQQHLPELPPLFIGRHLRILLAPLPSTPSASRCCYLTKKKVHGWNPSNTFAATCMWSKGLPPQLLGSYFPVQVPNSSHFSQNEVLSKLRGRFDIPCHVISAKRAALHVFDCHCQLPYLRWECLWNASGGLFSLSQVIYRTTTRLHLVFLTLIHFAGTEAP